MEELKKKIREIPDYPKPGILFYDVTTLLKDADGLRAVIDILIQRYKNQGIQKVLGIEARGFILAPALAYHIGAGFVPVRKKGKLPSETLSASYELEYGTDTLEVHKDAIKPGERVVLIDDLIATGGTAAATAGMIKELGGNLVEIGFLIELSFLNGREKIPAEFPVFSILHY
jgi:adenine phosphoribosyltransferase